MIHYKEFKIAFVDCSKNIKSKILLMKSSNTMYPATQPMEGDKDGHACPQVICMVDKIKNIETGSKVVYENKIHTIGQLTRSSGFLGYYSDKNQWFYEDHKGVIVATSDENDDMPNLSEEDIKWCIENYNKNDNKNVAFVELFADPTGNIVLVNEKSVGFSIKSNSDGTIKVNKSGLQLSQII